MLKRIELRNFAIVTELELDLTPGLNVLSGETGAGKSIVVDALALLAGARADSSFVRAGAESALVQAEFEGAGFGTAARRLATNGRHAARIDGEVVTVAELAERVGSQVVVFAQHGALELQGSAAQRAQLDRLLPEEARRALVRLRQAHARRQSIRASLEDVRSARRDRARRLDVLGYQVREIDEVSPRRGEDEALEEELDTLRHAERVSKGAAAALAALASDEGGAVSGAADAVRELKGAARHAAALGPLTADLEAALNALSAVGSEIESFLAGFESDPARLDAVQARLARLDGLKRKYGEDISAVLAFREEAETERRQLESLDEDEESLAAEEADLTAEVEAASEVVSRARREAAARLENEVAPLLGSLGMPGATFEVQVSRLEEPTSSGADAVAFAFSANVGEPAGPVSAIASGGELSRLMLALHVVTGTAQACLAFDEVDAGIGGRAAREVGALLKSLSTGRQVLVVTHLAQVAAFADSHFVVAKEEVAGRTTTRVGRADGRRRIEELARMLSGTVTDASISHARELLAEAGQVLAHQPSPA